MKREAPAVQRNRDPILGVLGDVLPNTGTVLEIAAGTGEHAAYFAQRFPGLTWQPTDGDATALASIQAWVDDADAQNLRSPLHLDVRMRPWPVDEVSALIAINMVHISPWESTLALMAGAGEVLEAGGVLYLYGPYKTGGRHTASSNADFDGWLKGRDPAWGVRDLETVIDAAAKAGLTHQTTAGMPANNLSVVFRRD